MLDARYARLRATRAYEGSDVGATSPVVPLEDLVYTDHAQAHNAVVAAEKQIKAQIHKRLLEKPENKKNPTVSLTAHTSGEWREDIVNGVPVKFPVVTAPTASLSNIPLMGTSKDGYLSAFNVTKHRWTRWSDQFGAATVPLTQVFTVETSEYLIRMNATVQPEHYFRAFVPLFTTNKGFLLFSDFRAVAPLVDTRVFRKTHYGSDCASIPYKDDAEEAITMNTPYGPVSVAAYNIDHSSTSTDSWALFHNSVRSLIGEKHFHTCIRYTPVLAYTQRGLNAMEYAYISEVEVDLEHVMRYPGDYHGAMKRYQQKQLEQVLGKKAAGAKTSSGMFVDAADVEEVPVPVLERISEDEVVNVETEAKIVKLTFREQVDLLKNLYIAQLDEIRNKESPMQHFDSVSDAQAYLSMLQAVKSDVDALDSKIERFIVNDDVVLQMIPEDVLETLTTACDGNTERVLMVIQEAAEIIQPIVLEYADTLQQKTDITAARIKALELIEQARETIRLKREAMERQRAEQERFQLEESERIRAEYARIQAERDNEIQRMEEEAQRAYEEHKRTTAMQAENARKAKLYRRAMDEIPREELEKQDFDEVVRKYEAIVAQEDEILATHGEGYEEVKAKRDAWDARLEHQRKVYEEHMSRRYGGNEKDEL